jgi:hypothetical protein
MKLLSSGNSRQVMQRSSVQALARIIGAPLWVFLLLVVSLGLPIAGAYWATAFLSCLIFYLAFEFKRSNALLSLGIALIFGIFHDYVWFRRLVLPSVGMCLAELGLAAFLLVGLRILWSKDETVRKRLLTDVLIPSAALVAVRYAVYLWEVFASRFVNIVGFLHGNGKTFDLYAFSFDGSLGFQPSFVVGQLMQKHPWFGFPTVVAYYAILLPITLAYVVHLKWGGGRRFFMLEIFFAAGFLGCLFYSLFPAAGPIYVFGASFPWSTLSFAMGRRLYVEPIPLAGNIMRNALPSLHMTWALLIWWNMKPISRTFSWASFLYVLFTICGTLGTGEHYLVDLVVAFPFALMIQAMCTRELSVFSSARGKAMFGGLGGTLAWICLLRYGNHLFWLSPVIPWILIVATVAASLSYVQLLLRQSNPVTGSASVKKEAISTSLMSLPIASE